MNEHCNLISIVKAISDWEEAVVSHLRHLDLPDDMLRAGGGRVAALAVQGTHGAAAIHRVHTVDIWAWTQSTNHKMGLLT